MNRRSFALGVATTLGLTLLPRAARAGTSRLLIIGGSTMGGALGMYLEKRLGKQGYKVLRRSKGSSGLARPDFFNWPKEAAKQREKFAPEGTVVMFGGNDGQGLYMGKNSDPKWIRWNDEGWAEEYAKRVATFSDAVAPGDEHIFWIGMPPMKSPKLNGRMERMNTIFRAEMEGRANGHFLDTAPMLGKGGKYADQLKIGGHQVKVRAPDGVHLTGKGATVIVDNVIPKIRETIFA
jgi:hypothetical protein